MQLARDAANVNAFAPATAQMLADTIAPLLNALDLRGQGGSQRMAEEPYRDVTANFADFEEDVRTLMDGLVRDIRAIRKMEFPVFHGGIGPLDSKGRGKIMALDVPIECAGVAVAHGDLVFGDADGVVVVPQAVEQQVLDLAFEKVKGERSTLQDLRRGDKLADVFARYGIL